MKQVSLAATVTEGLESGFPPALDYAKEQNYRGATRTEYPDKPPLQNGKLPPSERENPSRIKIEIF